MMDKKILIFDAVLSLIKENGFHSKIKISDIANKAGIGKGTVYEYFSNKEEILTESIIYQMKHTINDILKDYDDLKFEDRLKCLIKRIFVNFNDNQSFHSLFMSQNIGSMIGIEMKMAIKKEVEKIKKDFDIVFEDIIKEGIKENLLPKTVDDFSIMISKTTLMSATMEFIRCNRSSISLEEDEFVSKLYDNIVKILS